MSGKHDRTPDEPAGLLQTGPIVIRGLGRGVRDVMSQGGARRHRASSEASGEGLVVEEAVASEDEAITDDLSPSARLGQTGAAPEVEGGRMDLDEHDGVDPRADVAAGTTAAADDAAPDPGGDDGSGAVGPHVGIGEPAARDDDALDVHEEPGSGSAPATRSVQSVQLAQIVSLGPTAPDRAAAGAPVEDLPADDRRDEEQDDDAQAIWLALQSIDEDGSDDGVREEAHPDPSLLRSEGERGPTDADRDRDRDRAVLVRGRSARPVLGAGLRQRFGREAAGIAVLVVLALVCAGLIVAVVVKTRGDAALAAREAAAYTPPPLATPTPEPTGPVVAVIGDGSLTQAAPGVRAAERWPAILQSALSGSVVRLTSAGSGYTASTATGATFAERADDVPADADAVVFFGGVADAGTSSLSLAKAATTAIGAATTAAPDAKILVVGPVIAAGASDADLMTIRNSLRGAAGIARATWIDPIGSRWLPASARESPSFADLTASDERTIEAKLRTALEKSLR